VDRPGGLSLHKASRVLALHGGFLVDHERLEECEPDQDQRAAVLVSGDLLRNIVGRRSSDVLSGFQDCGVLLCIYSGDRRVGGRTTLVGRSQLLRTDIFVVAGGVPRCARNDKKARNDRKARNDKKGSEGQKARKDKRVWTDKKGLD
jgi:hypothetical protein